MLNGYADRLNREGIQYIRKELGAGLLRTCKRAYRDIMPIFYRTNTWRFSDDLHWTHLYRFLLTIGLDARTQLRRIKVLAPTGRVRQYFNQEWPAKILRVKDVPEVRFVTAPLANRSCDSKTQVLDTLRQLPPDTRLEGEPQLIIPKGYFVYEGPVLRSRSSPWPMSK